MKTGLIALFLCLAAACAPKDDLQAPPSAAGAAAGDEAAVRAGVEALLHEWSAAGSEGRWDDLKALYADDPGFAWIENGAVAYSDHASVITGVDQVIAMNATLKSDVRDIVVTPISADAAAFRSSVEFAFTSSAFSFDFDGAFTGVAVMREGKWRFLQGHLSKADDDRG